MAILLLHYDSRIMCIYTKYIDNPKYKPNKKNKRKPPICTDERLKTVPIKCGKCIECRRQKQREWIVRMSEEIRHDSKAQFVTLTMSNMSFLELRKTIKKGSENDIMTLAVRRFLERIRKETGKSVKHWFITELGEERGRIHIHGIMWCEPELINKWKYGHVFIGTHVNEATIFYITKYITKQNPINKTFIGKILCSAGIGSAYLKRKDSNNNKYKESGTNETYRLRNGVKINLPMYYRNKIYSEEEKELLWKEKLDRGYRYIMGEKVSMENEEEYLNLQKFYQQQGIKIHGDNLEVWEREKQLKAIQRLIRHKEKVINEANKPFIKSEKRLIKWLKMVDKFLIKRPPKIWKIKTKYYLKEITNNQKKLA